MAEEQTGSDEWAELAALAEELRGQDEQWRATCEAMAAQLELVRGVREGVEQQLAELGVEEHLARLARELLNDAGRLHSARLNYGLTRSLALLWHALDDPRASRREAPPEAEYAVEVRVGPRYLLGVPNSGSGDERISIVIAGQKRLVATLPTTREKFRAALLRAFAAPSYSGPPREDTAAEPAAGADAAGEHGAAPESAEAAAPAASGETPAAAQAAEAAAGAGGAAASAPPGDAAAPQGDEPPPKPRRRRRKASE